LRSANQIVRNTTERKRSESALRENKSPEESLRDDERLNAVFDSSPVPQFVIGRNHRVIHWNKALEVYSGIKAEDVVGTNHHWKAFYNEERPCMADLLVDEDMQGLAKWYTGKYDESSLVEDAYEGVDFFPSMVGKGAWLSFTAAIIRDNDGNIIAAVETLQDITQRKRMEEEIKRYSEHLEELVKERTNMLTESEERFRGIAERSVDEIFEVDLEGRMIYASPAVESILGYRPDEVVGTPFHQHLVPSEVSKAVSALTNLTDGKNVEAVRFTALRKDRSQVLVEVSCSPIVRYGRVVGAQGIIRDITERVKMEEELRDSRDQLEHVLATNPAVLYFEEALSDFSDTYSTYVSESARTVLGFEPKKFLGEAGLRFWRSRLQPDDLVRYWAELPILWRDGHHTFQYRFLHRDGTYRWITEQYRVIRDVEGRISNIVGVAIDVTERKELEEKLAKAERLAIIGEIAAMVGHDLRNPLQGITSAANLLRKESLSTNQRNEILQLIERCVAHSDKITRDLLDYAQTFQLSLVESTPKHLIASALATIQVPDKIKVHHQSQEQPVISVDSDKMKRVLVNLIQNAIDAMPQGGTLTTSSEQISGNVEIFISDTGSGIPEKVMKNLWKPLQTTKAKGLGLGLAICKRVIDAHGGSIAVKSGIGEGTTVTICLPMKTEVAEVREK